MCLSADRSTRQHARAIHPRKHAVIGAWRHLLRRSCLVCVTGLLAVGCATSTAVREAPAEEDSVFVLREDCDAVAATLPAALDSPPEARPLERSASLMPDVDHRSAGGVGLQLGRDRPHRHIASRTRWHRAACAHATRPRNQRHGAWRLVRADTGGVDRPAQGAAFVSLSVGTGAGI